MNREGKGDHLHWSLVVVCRWSLFVVGRCLSLVVLVFVFYWSSLSFSFIGRVMSPHNPDQMSQSYKSLRSLIQRMFSKWLNAMKRRLVSLVRGVLSTARKSAW